MTKMTRPTASALLSNMDSDPSPAGPAAADVREMLLAHAPFSSLRAADLDRLQGSILISRHAAGEAVLVPSSARPERCWLIDRGAVRGELPGRGSGTPGVASEADWDGGAGDMFPLGALIARRGTTRTYRAAQPTVLLSFPASAFDELIEHSPAFADFCARRLAHLVDLARAKLQAEYVVSVTEQQGSATPLASLSRRAPIMVDGEMPVGDALRLMEQHRIGALPIVDGRRHPIGIFTQQDVIGRVVLPQRGLDTPIHELASVPVVTLPQNATAGDAALAITSRGIRHVVVVDASGAVSGVVSERDLFGLQRLSVRELTSDIRRASEPAALRRIADDVRGLAHALVAQGVASGQLTRMIASLNDQIVHRLLDLAAPWHRLDGLALCWIGMGSEGRSEQTVATDQDNGLIFVAGDGTTADAVRERLLPFAREVNTTLDALGYPLCKGNVMAMNPRWCASLDEWRAAFRKWIDRGDPDSLLASSIFFDFRGLWGEVALAQGLRADVAAGAKRNARFLKQMSDNSLRSRAPLNWFGEISATKDASGVEGVDLKHQGTSLFVDGARILALASGSEATNTSERLNQAGPAQGVPANEVRSWIDAFDYLQLLRLRTQSRRAAGALPPSDNPNFLPLRDLSDLDRRIVRHALHQARSLQQRLELDYPG